MDEQLVAEKREELHDAIQGYFVALTDGPVVVSDWVVHAEMGDENLIPRLYMGTSANMSIWKLLGMSILGAKGASDLAMQ